MNQMNKFTKNINPVFLFVIEAVLVFAIAAAFVFFGFYFGIYVMENLFNNFYRQLSDDQGFSYILSFAWAFYMIGIILGWTVIGKKFHKLNFFIPALLGALFGALPLLVLSLAPVTIENPILGILLVIVFPFSDALTFIILKHKKTLFAQN